MTTRDHIPKLRGSETDKTAALNEAIISNLYIDFGANDDRVCRSGVVDHQINAC